MTTIRPPRPDRESVPFSWYVTCGMPAYLELTGVRFDRGFREFDAIVEAYNRGHPQALEIFGPEVRYDPPGWPGISYGHVNCLGSPLKFPEGSEVAVTPIHHSLDQGIAALDQETDWAQTGMMPFYLDLWTQLKNAFPDLNLPFRGFGFEGPITTAWELRGHDFFMDAYDDVEKYHAYMSRVTQSIVDYVGFLRKVNDEPKRPAEMGMCDDISAMFSPARWPEWVLPYQEQYYALQTNGPRSAHIENFVPDHLPHLDTLGLASFDPSVSPRLQATDLRDRCSVPFWWRLNAMQLRDFTKEQIREHVFGGVADGASGVFLNITRSTLSPEAVAKTLVFMQAARDVATTLKAGCPRERLREAG